VCSSSPSMRKEGGATRLPRTKVKEDSELEPSHLAWTQVLLASHAEQLILANTSHDLEKAHRPIHVKIDLNRVQRKYSLCPNSGDGWGQQTPGMLQVDIMPPGRHQRHSLLIFHHHFCRSPRPSSCFCIAYVVDWTGLIMSVLAPFSG